MGRHRGRGRDRCLFGLALLHLVEFLQGVLPGLLRREGGDPCEDHEPERHQRGADPSLEVCAGERGGEHGADGAGDGEADLVAYGVPFLANPDLPYRFGKKAKLNAPDQATFYAGEEKGYTDYPALV